MANHRNNISGSTSNVAGTTNSTMAAGKKKKAQKRTKLLLDILMCRYFKEDKWNDLKLSHQLIAYVGLSFIIFFVFFVTLLCIFALYIFAEYNIEEIKD